MRRGKNKAYGTHIQSFGPWFGKSIETDPTRNVIDERQSAVAMDATAASTSAFTVMAEGRCFFGKKSVMHV